MFSVPKLCAENKEKSRIPGLCYSLSRISLVLIHETVAMCGVLLSLFWKCSTEILILTSIYLEDKKCHTYFYSVYGRFVAGSVSCGSVETKKCDKRHKLCQLRKKENIWK